MRLKTSMPEQFDVKEIMPHKSWWRVSSVWCIASGAGLVRFHKVDWD